MIGRRLSGSSPFNGETQEDTFANIKLVRYDAHALYHNVTKYSMKFIYQTLKRSPRYDLTSVIYRIDDRGAPGFVIIIVGRQD